MATVLVLTSSLNGPQGESSKLAKAFADQYISSNESSSVVYRDLSDGSVPHLSAESFSAFSTLAEELSTEQQQAVALSDQLIGELQAADHIVIGMPMYNFGVPSTFKAWIDHVARAGVTFKYGAQGPEGQLKNKQVTVLAARGGKYSGTPADTQTDYIKQVLAFLGLDRVEFVYAEGLAMGGDNRADALANAQQKISEVAAA